MTRVRRLAGVLAGPHRWWRGRTLRARLALLVAAAVAVGVLGVAGLAWAAVGFEMRQQVRAELETDAATIAAQPQRWRQTTPVPEGQAGPADERRWAGVGPRWQILRPDGTVMSDPAGGLPVTAAARRVAAGRQPRGQEQVRVGRDSYSMLTVPATGGGAVQVAIDSEPGEHTLAVLGALLLLGCAAGVAVAALLGRAVARAGLNPVQRLTESVERVAVTLDLTGAIAVVGQDEVARLARSVNTMLAALDASRQAQRTLVQDASHELRTPLTSIRTNVELLLTVERHPEMAHRLPAHERLKLLGDLDAQVVELTKLTGELVELAREETSREAPEEVNLAEVVDAAVARARMRAPAVAFTTDARPAVVWGRAGELERMVLNVLDNAAKWSPPGGTVRTTVGAGGGSCRVSVADEGPGIDAHDLPYVFDRFYRASTARALPGSGLGLAIVAQTARQHGGRVTAARGDAGGAVITIDLPCLIAVSGPPASIGVFSPNS